MPVAPPPVPSTPRSTSQTAHRRSATESAAEQFLVDRVEAFRKALWWAELTRHLLVLALAIATAVGLWILVDHWLLPHQSFAQSEGLFQSDPWIRGAVLATLVVWGVAFVVWKVVPLLRGTISPEYAARSLERSNPDLRQALTSFITLRQQPGQAALSQRVVKSIGRSTAAYLKQHDELPREATGNLMLWMATAVAAALLLVYAALSPKNSISSIHRLIAPAASIGPTTRVRIDQVRPGDSAVIAGRGVTVSARVSGLRESETVRCEVQYDQGATVKSYPLHQDPSTVRTRFAGGVPVEPLASGTLSYRVIAGDARSPVYQFNVQDVPVVSLTSVSYDPPDYTGIAPFIRSTGNLSAVDGTRVTIAATANRRIDRAAIEFNPRPVGDSVVPTDGTIEMDVADDGLSLSVTFPLRIDRRPAASVRRESYRLRVWDASNVTNPDPIIYPIHIVADLPPEVAIMLPTRVPKDIPIGAQQVIEVHASDADFGLRQIRLEMTHGIRSLGQPVLWRHPLGIKGNQVAEYRFRPSRLGLSPGDVVRVVAVATDNRSDPLAVGDAAASSLVGNQTTTDAIKLRIVASDQLTDDPIAAGEGLSRPDEKPAAQPDQADQQDQSDPSQQGDSQQGDSGQRDSQQGDSGQDDSGQDDSGQDDSGQGQSQQDGGGAQGNQGSQQSGDAGQQDSGGGGSGGSQQDAQQQNQQGDGENGGGGSSASGGDSGDNNASPNATSGDLDASEANQRNPAAENSGPSDSRAGQETGDSDGPESTGQNSPAQDSVPQGSSKQQPAGDRQAGTGSDAPGQDASSPDKSGQQDNRQSGDTSNQASDNQASGDKASGDQNPGKQSSSNQNPSGGESPLNDAKSDRNDARNSRSPESGKPEDGSADDSPSKPSHDGEAFERIRDYLNQQQKSGQSSESASESPEASPESSSSTSDPSKTSGRNASDLQQPQQATPPSQSNSQQSQPGQRQSGDSRPDPAATDSPSQDSGARDDASSTNPQSGSDPGGEKESDADGSKSGDENAAGDGSSSTTNDDDDDQGQPSPSETSSEKAKPSGKPSTGDDASAKPSADQTRDTASGKQENRQADAGQKRSPDTTPQGHAGTGQGTGETSIDAAGDNASPPQAANDRYAREATDLVLDYLEQTRDQPDPELLKRLDWTQQDLRRFQDRWKDIRNLDQAPGAIDADANRSTLEALRSLGLRPPSGGVNRKSSDQADAFRGIRDSGQRRRPPAAFRDAFDAFRRQVAEQEP